VRRPSQCALGRGKVAGSELLRGRGMSGERKPPRADARELAAGRQSGHLLLAHADPGAWIARAFTALPTSQEHSLAVRTGNLRGDRSLLADRTLDLT